MLVSAIITTHKRHPSIVKRAVQSVMKQTYKDIEIIVVDDSPSDYEYRDEVRKTVYKLEPSIKYIQNKKNIGACASRNIGANLAKGDILGFLDDDDEWCPNKIKKMIGLFSQKEIGLVYCGAIGVNEKEEKKELILKWQKGHIYDSLLLYNYIGSTSFPLVKKTAFDKVGGFDVDLRSSQDHDMWLRIAKEYEVDYVKDNLVIYYLHTGEQITKNREAVLQGQQRMYTKYYDDIKKDRKVFWKRSLMLSSAYGRNHKTGKAVLYWCKSVMLKPNEIRENLQVLYFSIIKMQ